MALWNIEGNVQFSPEVGAIGSNVVPVPIDEEDRSPSKEVGRGHGEHDLQPNEYVGQDLGRYLIAVCLVGELAFRRICRDRVRLLHGQVLTVEKLEKLWEMKV